jgi:heat shock protein HslJ
MKAILGFAFFLLFLAGIAFVMLQGRQMAQIGAPGGGSGITGIKWHPVIVGDSQVPEDSGMFIRFEVDGGIKGHGGCNAFFGSLEQTETGIAFGPIGATRMACPEPIMNREISFFEILEKTTSFMSGKDTLHLLDEENTVIVEFIAGPDA